MPQDDAAKRNKGYFKSSRNPLKRRGFWLIILAVLMVGSAILLPALIDENPSERTKLLVPAIFNLLLFWFIIFQTYIYKDQRDIMGVAINPRLRVSNVRVEDFEAGKEPVFIVSIVNDGATDAKDVALNIRVNLAEEDTIAVRWSRPQVVTIPAGREQHYFVQWRSPIKQEHIDAFNKSEPLKVSGFFKLGDSEQKDFCYRYYPWKGERPKGIDQFIPCDFNPALTHVVKVKAIKAAVALGTPTITVQNIRAEEAQPKVESGANRKDEKQNPNPDTPPEP